MIVLDLIAAGVLGAVLVYLAGLDADARAGAVPAHPLAPWPASGRGLQPAEK